eukprot:UN00345
MTSVGDDLWTILNEKKPELNFFNIFGRKFCNLHHLFLRPRRPAPDVY